MLFIDLQSQVKEKINDIQTVQLEPGATTAKKYPAEISGNTVSILPFQSSDDNFIQVSNITPPSDELGRSIGIDLTTSVKHKINNLYFTDLKSPLSYTSPNSAFPAGRGNTAEPYDSIHIVPITGADPDFIRVWDARYPHEDHVDNDYRDDKNVFIDLTTGVKTKLNNIQTVQLETRSNSS
jgi:hypothetical protein